MAIDLVRGLPIRVTESELYVLEPTTVDLVDILLRLRAEESRALGYNLVTSMLPDLYMRLN